MPIHEPANYLDQLIRQTRQHHVALSTTADQKANMLLTMSSVVLTLSLPQLGKPASGSTLPNMQVISRSPDRQLSRVGVK